MTVLVVHVFVSQKGDGADPTLLQPSHWNAAHTVQCGGGCVIGNTSGSEGPVQEIPLTAFGEAVLAAANAAVAGLASSPLKAVDMPTSLIPVSALSANAVLGGIPCVMGDGISNVQDGYKGAFEAPFPFTITGWKIMMNASTSVTVNVHQNGVNIITANITSASSGAQTNLNIAVAQGDTIDFTSSGSPSASSITMQLRIARTGG